MIKIKFLSIGKTKEAWLDVGVMEFVKRLSPVASFEFLFLKDEAHFEEALFREKHVVLLDPHGVMMDSEEFSHFFFREVERGGARLCFAIGGPTGLVERVKAAFSTKISLSRLTFTHQMSRLILMEQIFRAFEIQKGTQYHK